MQYEGQDKDYDSEEPVQHILQLAGIQLKTRACHSSEDSILNKD
jgi:hypothetical protein